MSEKDDCERLPPNDKGDVSIANTSSDSSDTLESITLTVVEETLTEILNKALNEAWRRQ